MRFVILSLCCLMFMWSNFLRIFVCTLLFFTDHCFVVDLALFGLSSFLSCYLYSSTWLVVLFLFGVAYVILFLFFACYFLCYHLLDCKFIIYDSCKFLCLSNFFLISVSFWCLHRRLLVLMYFTVVYYTCFRLFLF
jgi:hypothetical protein